MSVLKRMSKVAADGATDLRVRCLEALAQLLTLPVSVSLCFSEELCSVDGLCCEMSVVCVGGAADG